MRVVKNEPVLVAVLAPVIAAALARWGFNVPADDVSTMLIATLAVAAPIVRQFVTPTARAGLPPPNG